MFRWSSTSPQSPRRANSATAIATRPRMIRYHALYEASVCCSTMNTAVPMIGPSIVPRPPMMVANAISAVHCTLNTALGWTWSWLIASSAPAAPQPAPATTNTSSLARPTRAPGAAGGDLVVADRGEHQAEPAAQQQVDCGQGHHRDGQPGPVGIRSQQCRVESGEARQRHAGAAADRGEPLDDEHDGRGQHPRGDGEVPAAQPGDQPPQRQRRDAAADRGDRERGERARLPWSARISTK